MRYFTLSLISISIVFIYSCTNNSKNHRYEYIDLTAFEDGIHHWNLYSSIRTSARLDSGDIIGIADNLLAYQNKDGGWPKNIDWLAKITPDSVINNLSVRYRQSTFDNRNIFPQIEYLSKVYSQCHINKYRVGAEMGLKYILAVENSRGGWRGWDADVITFNDDVMTGIMNLLLDIKQGINHYYWIDHELRNELLAAYERGLSVILDCQISINNQKTAWCQQHDFITHKPVQGRAYEHPAVTARESCDVILFLMRIKEPDVLVKAAIKSSVAWLKDAKINGYRYMDIPIDEKSYHETTINFDRVFVPDSSAPPVWARYYDLKYGKPFLSLNDGTIVYKLSEVSFDRRVGYEWYGYWPTAVLAIYPEWENIYH